MLQDTYFFLLGLILGLLFVYICFGFEIKEKSTPKIKLNFKPFIIDSQIIVFNKHLHHWFIAAFSLIFLQVLFPKNNLYHLLVGYLIILVMHGLLYKDCFDFNICKKTN